MSVLQYITPGASDKRRAVLEEESRIREIKIRADEEIRKAKELAANQATWAATQKERDVNDMQGTLFDIFMRENPAMAAAAAGDDIQAAESAQKAARDYAMAEADKMKASGALATSAIDYNKYQEARGASNLSRDVGDTGAKAKVQGGKADFQENLVRAEKAAGAVSSAFGMGESGARRATAENMTAERQANEDYMSAPLTARADRAVAGWKERAAQNQLKMEMGNNTDLAQRAKTAELEASIVGSNMLSNSPALKYAPFMYQAPTQSQAIGGILGGAPRLSIPQQFLGQQQPSPMGTSALPANMMPSGGINAPIQMPSTNAPIVPLNLNDILRKRALQKAQGGQ